MSRIKIRWFYNEARILSYEKVLKGQPYATVRNNIATLVIPVLNNSFSGVYLCGTGNDLELTKATAIKIVTPVKPGKCFHLW